MSAPQLGDQVAVVVGASRGVGREIALALAAAGAHVVTVARAVSDSGLPGTASDTAQDALDRGGSAESYTCDVADRTAVTRLVEAIVITHGRVDLLINTTAHLTYDSLVDTTDADWDRAVAVNLNAPFYLTRAVAPLMTAQGHGLIVHLTGSGARHVSDTNAPTGATKAGLERLVRGAHAENLAAGVLVALFDPGPMRSERALARRADRDWTGVPEPVDVAASFVTWVGDDAREVPADGIVTYAGLGGLH